MFKERILIKRLFFFLDLLFISIAFCIAVKIQEIESIVSWDQWLDGFWITTPSHVLYLPYLLSAVVIWLTVLDHYEGYDLIRRISYGSLFWLIFKSVAVATLIFTTMAFVLDAMLIINRSFVLFFFLCSIGFLSIERFILHHFLHAVRKKGFSVRRFLVVGSGDRARRFANSLEANREWGLKVIGFIDEPELVGKEIDGKKVLGSFDDLEEIIDNKVIDEVFFAMPRKWVDQVEKYIIICEKVGVKATFLLDLFNTNIAKIRVREFDNVPLLCMETIPSHSWALLVKRLMDIIISGICLIILSPLFLITALSIKLSSEGPVILRQKRVGQNGRRFVMYKFRTMLVGAENLLEKVRELNEGKGPVFHSRSDPRVTKVGRYIRRFSLDELPQLFNVFKGDMSIVGPRPPLPDEVAQYERWQRRRLSLKPGLVCLWQVTKRYHTDFEEWVKTDLGYIDNWSLALDLKVLLLVIPAIYKGAKHWG